MAGEIISTIERRRHWPDEEKVRIMGEALAGSTSIAAVADRNGVVSRIFCTFDFG